MRTIRTRLADMESRCSIGSQSPVIAFMLEGAADDEITEVRNMVGDVIQLHPGDDLSRLVARAKALHTLDRVHVLHFDYRREAFNRLGGETLPVVLTDDPNPLEARS